MSYCSLDDIKQSISESELIELTDDNNQQINSEIVNTAICYAETTINSYLRSRYTLPLSEIPELIKVFAVDLAVYRLHSRRMMRNMPESILTSYKNVISELVKIQKGTVSLGIESNQEDLKIPDNNEFKTNKTSRDRIFTKDVLNRY